MPRFTRAQLRAKEAEGEIPAIHEDQERGRASSPIAYDPLSTAAFTRPPLGEIQNNADAASDNQSRLQRQPSRKVKGGKKGKGGDKNEFNLVLANDENILPTSEMEILEDESQSDTSSAAEVAAEELRKDEPVPETFQVPIDTTRPRTPPSAAAREASRALSKSPGKIPVAVRGSPTKTPRFDPVLHAETASASLKMEQENEDSFLGSIKSRTSAKLFGSLDSDGPDSFVKDIISRSPSKYITRIEDSVEAIDALEEAIEQVTEELPKAIAGDLESSTKMKSPRLVATKTGRAQKTLAPMTPAKMITKHSFSAKKPTPTANASKVNKALPPKPTPRAASARPQPQSSVSTNLQSQPRLNRVTMLDARAKSSKSSPPSNATANAPITRRTSTTLSTSRAPFVPAKSAKRPTKSTFTLPGEAFSAKMKAQREERRKKEEAEAEAARKRTEFRARPVPKTLANPTAKENKRMSSVTLPRENAASRARMSLITARKGTTGDAEGKGKENAGAAAKVTRTVSDGVRASPSVRKSMVPTTALSSLSVAKRGTMTPGTVQAKKTHVPANSSAVRRSNTIQTAPFKARPSLVPNRTGPTTRTASDSLPSKAKPTTAVVKDQSKAITGTGSIKGKEVFSRGKVAEGELLKQKREKEEAAKKARAEAAERGRLASREWAEKQRKRKPLAMGEKGTVVIGEERTKKGLVGSKAAQAVPANAQSWEEEKRLLGEEKNEKTSSPSSSS